jgi:hypothetical protein
MWYRDGKAFVVPSGNLPSTAAQHRLLLVFALLCSLCRVMPILPSNRDRRLLGGNGCWVQSWSKAWAICFVDLSSLSL